MLGSTIERVNKFTRRSHTLKTLKTFLQYELCAINRFYLNYRGKICKLYSSDSEKYYGKYFVRCYFPRENICFILSAADAVTFPVVSPILSGAYKEKGIRVNIYVPEIKNVCSGPLIVILDTVTESIVLEDGKTLKSTCVSATGDIY